MIKPVFDSIPRCTKSALHEGIPPNYLELPRITLNYPRTPLISPQNLGSCAGKLDFMRLSGYKKTLRRTGSLQPKYTQNKRTPLFVPLEVYTSTYKHKGTEKGRLGRSLTWFGFFGGEFAGRSGEFRGVRTPFFSRIFGGAGDLAFIYPEVDHKYTCIVLRSLDK